MVVVCKLIGVTWCCERFALRKLHTLLQSRLQERRVAFLSSRPEVSVYF